MIDRDRVHELAKALKFSANNHHRTSMLFDANIGTVHYGQHWQHCPAISCTAAFTALFKVGVFKEKELQTRKRVQEKALEKLDAPHD